MNKWVLYFLVGIVLFIVLGIPLQFVYEQLHVYRYVAGNMEPTILVNSIIRYEPASSYQVGDVIMISRANPNRPNLISRIISINDDGSFSVKGDHNLLQIKNSDLDETHVPATAIFGKVSDFTIWWFGALFLRICIAIVVSIFLVNIFTKYSTSRNTPRAN